MFNMLLNVNKPNQTNWLKSCFQI